MNNARYRLGGFSVIFGCVMALLTVIRRLLEVPSGYDADDMLGWVNPLAVESIKGLWETHLDATARWVYNAYVVLDLVWFMPLYAVVFTSIWQRAHQALVSHSNRPAVWAMWIVQAGTGFLLALLLADLVENIAGLYKMGPSWVTLAEFVLAVTVAWFVAKRIDGEWLVSTLKGAFGVVESPPATWRQILRPAALLFVALGLLVGIVLSFVVNARCEEGSGIWWLACRAHAVKAPLVGAILAVPLALGIWVLFGPHEDDQKWVRFVSVRKAFIALIVRCRYVLLALIACMSLLLVMNQGRDVIYALASHPWAENATAWHWIQAAIVLALTAGSLLMFGFTCWMWSRLAMQITPRAATASRQHDPLQCEDLLARYWARMLGIAPAILIFAMTLATLPHAVVLNVANPIWVLLGFAALVVVGAVAFVWNRDRASMTQKPLGYFDVLPLNSVLELTEGKNPTFNFLGIVPPRLLPVIALLLAMLCRAAMAGFPLEWHWPSLTLPTMFFLLTFWLSLAGWVSLFEESEAVPWFFFVLVLIGVLGSIAAAENHRVSSSLPGLPAGAGIAFASTALMAIVLLVAYRLLLTALPRSASTASKPGATGKLSNQRKLWLFLAMAVVAMLLALVIGDRLAAAGSSRKTSSPAAEHGVMTAPMAVSSWLGHLCGGDGKTPPKDCNVAPGLPVYVVAAEGGGMRAAFWSALAMSRLWEKNPAVFESQVFAMTGVSGGALGLAVFRACLVESMSAASSLAKPGEDPVSISISMRNCVNRFGTADLLGPLVGAWFFEDAIARVIPMSLCTQPGCGFMSRGLWFEEAIKRSTKKLELGSDGMETGMIQSRDLLVGDSTRRGHTPYLMLNATWVETGERSIASELAIDWKYFPGARDQIGTFGNVNDLSLAAAGHNSSRFPFTNALGAVHTDNAGCSPDAYRNRLGPVRELAATKRCGHLADGGYFDNSAGHTAADLLRLISRCLVETQAAENAACPGLGPASRQVLAANLRPRMIVVRNGINPSAERIRSSGCDRPVQPEAADVRMSAAEPSSDLLSKPVCAGNASLYIDLLGPLITAINTTGVGANGRLAVARPASDLTSFGLPHGDGAVSVPGVVFIDLLNDGPLFPLGWHLAPSVQSIMKQQATDKMKAFGDLMSARTNER